MNSHSSHTFEAEFLFSIHYHTNNEPFINVSVNNLSANNPYSMEEYSNYSRDIQEFDYTKELLENIDLTTLSDEKEYYGKATINLEYSSWVDQWSGGTEYDLDVNITFKEYKEYNDIDENSLMEPQTLKKFFEYYTNNDGDYLKVWYVNKDKLLVEVGHCCVKRRMIIHPMTLTKLLFNYEKEKAPV